MDSLTETLALNSVNMDNFKIKVGDNFGGEVVMTGYNKNVIDNSRAR